MIAFGSQLERTACLLHEARMQECYGNWSLPSRFRWPETREQWEHYQHHPHSAVLQALAQAKAIEARRAETTKIGSIEDESAVAKRFAQKDHP